MGCCGSEDENLDQGENNMIEKHADKDHKDGEEGDASGSPSKVKKVEAPKSKNVKRSLRAEDEFHKNWLKKGKAKLAQELIDIRNDFIKCYGELGSKIDASKFPLTKKPLSTTDKATKNKIQFFGNQELKKKVAHGFGFLLITTPGKTPQQTLFEGNVKDWKPAGKGRLFQFAGKAKDASGKEVPTWVGLECTFGANSSPVGEGHMMNSLGNRFDGLFNPSQTLGIHTVGGASAKGEFDSKMELTTGIRGEECGTWKAGKIEKEMTQEEFDEWYQKRWDELNKDLKNKADTISKNGPGA